MKFIKQINKLVTSFQKIILLLSSLFIVIGLTITVIMRYFVKSDLFGLEELLIIPSFWLYFLGASYASYKKYHITVDIVSTYITNSRVLNFIEIITSLITVFVALLMSLWALDYVKWTYINEAKSSAWQIPLYIQNTSVFIGFVLMTVYVLRDAVLNTYKLIKGTI